jgi:vitamin B12 transporter
VRKLLLFFGTTILPWSPAAAQDSAAPDQPVVIAEPPRETLITVVATGTRETIHETGQPVTVIGHDEIEAVQGGDLTRVLERAPGVTLSRNGGPGAYTGLSLRGAEPDQLLVMVDGIRVADPAAPAAGYDFANLLPAGIGKIELLRGSNGTIWGSQAIGGVLAAWTRFAPGLEASAEGGSRDTAYLTALGGVEQGALQLTANAAWYRTGGFSAAANGSEPDGFDQWQAGGYAKLGIAPGLRLRGALHYADARVDLDGYPAPDYLLADTAEYQKTHLLSALAGFEYFRDWGLQLTGAWSSSDTRRDHFDPATGSAPSYRTHGHSDRLDARGVWSSDAWHLWFGGESEWSWFDGSFDARHHARLMGAYAQAGRTFAGALTVNAGARVADHSRFGSAVTLGADASWDLGHGWYLRASYGEGFKAPSLFQLYSDYGNQALRPERSTSVDLGVSLGDRNEAPYLSLTLFRRDSEDLVAFVSCFGMTAGICAGRPYGTYDNLGRARAQGVELEGLYEVAEGLSARLAWSYVETEDRTPGSPEFGNTLARRPRNALSLGAEWRVADQGPTLGADLRWSSASFDDAANTVRLAPYAVLDLTARWPVTRMVELYGRIENAWNERYQTAAGYASPPRGAFAGARVRL